MISDSLLQLFVRTLGSHKHVKRGAITRHDGDNGGLPLDVGRVLGHVGGWRYGDLRFIEPAQLDRERAKLTDHATAVEAGRSRTWSHALWNSAWYPLAISSIEVHAFDPVGCFGGSPEQVVSFDVSSGDAWCVFPTISSWLTALTEGFETDGKDALEKAYAWAREHRACVDVKLPPGEDERRAKARFEAGVGSWIELRHPDGRCWAVRERRDGFELRIGEGDDAVTRTRTAAKPSAEVRRLVREQQAEGFVRSGA
ncbi:MAG: hypothetical protein IPL61_08380 [Myxococcales bacterium]|nr:hypothetical protein [Myxococcales bacterium]